MNPPRLLLLTDRAQLRLGRGLVRTVRECVEAGLTHVLVRELDLPEQHRAALVAALADLEGLTVLSAHSLLPGADGVHLPAAPAAPDACNAGFHRLPKRRGAWEVGRTPRYMPVVGVSCHSAEDVRRAAAEGAAYATLSPYAPSGSKPGYGPPIDPADLAGHHIPVLALGGVGPDNAAEARAHGAYGVAVMGAVMRAPEPAAVVRTLLAEVAP